MSIPTSFNPLGVLRGRQPFPMVRLTSNTTGSTVDGEPLPEGFNVTGIMYTGGEMTGAWRAFDGALDKNTGQYNTNQYWQVDFGREVKLNALRVYWSGAGSGNTLELQYKKDGEWLSAGVEYDQKGGTSWHDSGKISIKAQMFRLYKNKGSNKANLFEVEYEAFFA